MVNKVTNFRSKLNMTTSKFIPAVAFHPGMTLAEKLKEMDMGIKEFAIRTSKPEKTIHAVIKGESSITSDMAVAFESVTNIPAHFWLNKQRNYDEYQARARREAIIADSCEWAKKFPYAQMVRLGWIEPYTALPDQAKSLMAYFQISSVKAWQDYYLNQKLKVAFRISLANAKNPYALSAWLRQGELQAMKITTKDYSESKLRNLIPILKKMMTESPSDFALRVQTTCAEAGIKLIYTPCLSKAPVSGSTRWINGHPCIQISGHHKRYDIYWFTLFHEIGHILLHGKKDIFLENNNYNEEEQKKENEANKFASNLLLLPEEENEIIKKSNFTIDAINDYARKFKTHPSVIVGRLHHNKVLSLHEYHDVLTSINLNLFN